MSGASVGKHEDWFEERLRRCRRCKARRFFIRTDRIESGFFKNERRIGN